LQPAIAGLHGNNCSCGVEGDGRGIFESVAACSFAADAADLRAVAAAKTLNTLIATVGSNTIAFAVKRHTAACCERCRRCCL
jgi:hypothetical protein